MSTVRPYSERIAVKPPKLPEIGPAPEHPETALAGLEPKPSAPVAAADEHFPGEAEGRAKGGGKGTYDAIEEDPEEEGAGALLETASVVSLSDLMFDGASVITYEGESICTPPAEISFVEKARIANNLAQALKEFTGDARMELVQKVATRIVTISPTSTQDELIAETARLALKVNSSKETDSLFGIPLLSDPKVLEKIAGESEEKRPTAGTKEPATSTVVASDIPKPAAVRKKAQASYTQELYQDLKTDPETAKVLRSLGITDENFEHRFTVFSAKDPVLRRYYAEKNTEWVKEALLRIYIKDFLNIFLKIENFRRIKRFICGYLNKLPLREQVEQIEQVLTERGYFLESIKEINAEDIRGLRILPACFTKIKSLEVIKLSGTRITFLPEEIGACVSLKKLDVHETDIESLPRAIGNLKALEILSVHKTKLQSIPEEIGECVSLKKLEVYGTDIKALPRSIGNLKALEFLSVHRTKLKSIPEEIGGCISLKKLDVWEINIEALPRTIGNLKTLETLLAYRTKLKSIPDEIEACVSLKRLGVSSTDIETLPRTIGNLKALEMLSVHQTKLKSIPEEIGECVSLKHLEVYGTDIETLPRSIGNLKALEFLSVHRTKLKSIPEEIGGCVSLKKLDVEKTDIKALPENIGFLKALEVYPTNIPKSPRLGCCTIA